MRSRQPSIPAARTAAPAADPRPRRSAERGFALVLALLALIAFSALAAGGFMLASSDLRVSENHTESVDAFYAAEAALQEHLGAGQLSATPTSYSYGGGTARVSSRRLLVVDGKSTLYDVRSTGSGPDRHGAGGSRTVGSVVLWSGAPFNLEAAFTAPPGLNKNGVAGTISGYDAATAQDCPGGGGQDVAGVAVPPGGFSMNGNGGGKGNGKGNNKGKGNGGGNGGGGGNQGGNANPPGVYGVPPVDASRSTRLLLAQTNIPWAGVQNGSAIRHDHVASQGYPSFSQLGPNAWPIVYLDSPSYAVSPTNSGRGILIADGDLVMNGSFSWDGLILAGGTITSNGNQTIRGAAVAGLDMLLGQNVAASNLGNGTWSFQYHSCNLLKALKAAGAPVEEPGTWTESL